MQQSSSDAVVSAEDGSGRMWALQRRTPGRTVVRFGRPGGHWRSRVLDPTVGATTVTCERNILMVVGPRRLFLSSDRGATWRLLTHHASPPAFPVSSFSRKPQVSADRKHRWHLTPANVWQLLTHSSSE